MFYLYGLYLRQNIHKKISVKIFLTRNDVNLIYKNLPNSKYFPCNKYKIASCFYVLSRFSQIINP